MVEEPTPHHLDMVKTVLRGKPVRARKYKVFCTTWHVMHYWDLFNALKDDVDFYLVHNNHRSWRDKRFIAARPIPENVQFVPYYEKGKYDFAILNVDQQIVNQNLGKSKLVRELLNEVQDIPVAVINHATPVYPEFVLQEGMTKQDAEDECRRIIMELVGDRPMVVNSYDSVKEWGRGTPIWHGMNPDEWLDLPKEPRIFTALSPGGCDEYYNRELMNRVSSELRAQFGHTLWWAKQNVDTHTSLDWYKQYLGSSLLYLDLSKRTPMNRARTEAMLSGSAIVQVEGAHDIDKFMEDGVNAYLVPEKMENIVMTIVDLLENRYQEALQVGQEGKKTACKMFDRERYRQDWLDFIHNELLP